ncbi:ABC transporter ATP-binding protein [Pseudoclavibacter sp. AY1F1]|uniref:ABC transporter ATP-binding protein n=1 Tax=Pseudoclavibacter sp. AY1F1 TaxID=2080583 RepID=UPI000CE8A8C5|nr:ATP-binding cassette domain-containing protein [Pseudoclavibacter sp. AY1F1]PPF41873.1 ABC transporter ATP-binding protein [Pseudoclavibacter sp. AY1F1]
MTSVTLRGVEKNITEADGQSRPIFADLSLTLPDDIRSAAILGRSGSGKSTLLRILSGLDVRYGGTYSFAGEELRRNELAMSEFRRTHVGIITQSYDLLRERTVLQNVMLGLGSTKSAYRAPALDALRVVGIEALAARRVGRLSGGEAQRVAIARAVVKKPALILADEPTGALDEDTEDRILDVFDTLQQQGAVLIVATHSERVAERCQRRFRIQGLGLVDEETLRPHVDS